MVCSPLLVVVEVVEGLGMLEAWDLIPFGYLANSVHHDWGHLISHPFS